MVCGNGGLSSSIYRSNAGSSTVLQEFRTKVYIRNEVRPRLFTRERDPGGRISSYELHVLCK